MPDVSAQTNHSVTGDPSRQVSGKVAKLVSGSGLNLPEVPDVRPEANNKGGLEFWHCPRGAIHRRNKTYLLVFGKRTHADLASDPDGGKGRIEQAIRTKLIEKGIGRV